MSRPTPPVSDGGTTWRVPPSEHSKSISRMRIRNWKILTPIICFSSISVIKAITGSIRLWTSNSISNGGRNRFLVSPEAIYVLIPVDWDVTRLLQIFIDSYCIFITVIAKIHVLFILMYAQCTVIKNSIPKSEQIKVDFTFKLCIKVCVLVFIFSWKKQEKTGLPILTKLLKVIYLTC